MSWAFPNRPSRQIGDLHGHGCSGDYEKMVKFPFFGKGIPLVVRTFKQSTILDFDLCPVVSQTCGISIPS